MTPRRVLFLCTGNYYRSRFAEAVFNHHAALHGLEWSACSRGLATHLAEGDLSPYTVDALTCRGIERRHTAPGRVSLCEQDLGEAEIIVAVYDAEHRPMISARYPEWEARIRYWDVPDIGDLPTEEAMSRIEALVLELIADLRTGAPDAA